jgi:hypothetical protein
MSKPLDWERLTRLAVESHATPRLWDVVSAFPDLPPEAQALQVIAAVNEFRLYHIRSMLVRTVTDLREAGVEVVLLKGAALLAGAVAKPTQRTMVDIDLLVSSGSPDVAWQVSQAKGWRIGDSMTTEAYREHHHLPPLVDSEGIGIGLELHRSLLPGIERLGLDADALLARSRTIRMGQTELRVPSREDLLLHACLHFAWSNKLSRGAWRTFADVHAIASDPQFDWTRFLDVVTTRRMRQSCYWTLRMGERLADLQVPAEVLKRLDPLSGGWLGPLLERHFACRIANPEAMAMVAERVLRWGWFAAMRESSTSGEADEIWWEGHVETSERQRPAATRTRGPFRRVIGTASYIAQLAVRGE